MSCLPGCNSAVHTQDPASDDPAAQMLEDTGPAEGKRLKHLLQSITKFHITRRFVLATFGLVPSQRTYRDRVFTNLLTERIMLEAVDRGEYHLVRDSTEGFDFLRNVLDSIEPGNTPMLVAETLVRVEQSAQRALESGASRSDGTQNEDAAPSSVGVEAPPRGFASRTPSGIGISNSGAPVDRPVAVEQALALCGTREAVEQSIVLDRYARLQRQDYMRFFSQPVCVRILKRGYYQQAASAIVLNEIVDKTVAEYRRRLCPQKTFRVLDGPIVKVPILVSEEAESSEKTESAEANPQTKLLDCGLHLLLYNRLIKPFIHRDSIDEVETEALKLFHHPEDQQTWQLDVDEQVEFGKRVIQLMTEAEPTPDQEPDPDADGRAATSELSHAPQDVSPSARSANVVLRHSPQQGKDTTTAPQEIPTTTAPPGAEAPETAAGRTHPSTGSPTTSKDITFGIRRCGAVCRVILADEVVGEFPLSATGSNGATGATASTKENGMMSSRRERGIRRRRNPDPAADAADKPGFVTKCYRRFLCSFSSTVAPAEEPDKQSSADPGGESNGDAAAFEPAEDDAAYAEDCDDDAESELEELPEAHAAEYQSARLWVLLRLNYTRHTIFTMVELYNALAAHDREQHSQTANSGVRSRMDSIKAILGAVLQFVEENCKSVQTEELRLLVPIASISDRGLYRRLLGAMQLCLSQNLMFDVEVVNMISACVLGGLLNVNAGQPGDGESQARFLEASDILAIMDRIQEQMTFLTVDVANEQLQRSVDAINDLLYLLTKIDATGMKENHRERILQVTNFFTTHKLQRLMNFFRRTGSDPSLHIKKRYMETLLDQIGGTAYEDWEEVLGQIQDTVQATVDVAMGVVTMDVVSIATGLRDLYLCAAEFTGEEEPEWTDDVDKLRLYSAAPVAQICEALFSVEALEPMSKLEAAESARQTAWSKGRDTMNAASTLAEQTFDVAANVQSMHKAIQLRNKDQEFVTFYVVRLLVDIACDRSRPREEQEASVHLLWCLNFNCDWHDYGKPVGRRALNYKTTRSVSVYIQEQLALLYVKHEENRRLSRAIKDDLTSILGGESHAAEVDDLIAEMRPRFVPPEPALEDYRLFHDGFSVGRERTLYLRSLMTRKHMEVCQRVQPDNWIPLKGISDVLDASLQVVLETFEADRTDVSLTYSHAKLLQLQKNLQLYADAMAVETGGSKRKGKPTQRLILPPLQRFQLDAPSPMDNASSLPLITSPRSPVTANPPRFKSILQVRVLRFRFERDIRYNIELPSYMVDEVQEGDKRVGEMHGYAKVFEEQLQQQQQQQRGAGNMNQVMMGIAGHIGQVHDAQQEAVFRTKTYEKYRVRLEFNVTKVENRTAKLQKTVSWMRTEVKKFHQSPKSDNPRDHFQDIDSMLRVYTKQLQRGREGLDCITRLLPLYQSSALAKPEKEHFVDRLFASRRALTRMLQRVEKDLGKVEGCEEDEPYRTYWRTVFDLRRILNNELDRLTDRAHQLVFECAIHMTFGDHERGEEDQSTVALTFVDPERGEDDPSNSSPEWLDPVIDLCPPPPLDRPKLRGTDRIRVHRYVGETYVLVGDPGMGKTTVLRRYYMQLARTHGLFVLMIPFTLADDPLTLVDETLRRHEFSVDMIAQQKQECKAHTHDRKRDQAVFIIDSVDESLHALVDLVKRLREEWGEKTVIVFGCARTCLPEDMYEAGGGTGHRPSSSSRPSTGKGKRRVSREKKKKGNKQEQTESIDKWHKLVLFPVQKTVREMYFRKQERRNFVLAQKLKRRATFETFSRWSSNMDVVRPNASNTVQQYLACSKEHSLSRRLPVHAVKLVQTPYMLTQLTEILPRMSEADRLYMTRAFVFEKFTDMMFSHARQQLLAARRNIPHRYDPERSFEQMCEDLAWNMFRVGSFAVNSASFSYVMRTYDNAEEDIAIEFSRFFESDDDRTNLALECGLIVRHDEYTEFQDRFLLFYFAASAMFKELERYNPDVDNVLFNGQKLFHLLNQRLIYDPVAGFGDEIILFIRDMLLEDRKLQEPGKSKLVLNATHDKIRTTLLYFGDAGPNVPMFVRNLFLIACNDYNHRLLFNVPMPYVNHLTAALQEEIEGAPFYHQLSVLRHKRRYDIYRHIRDSQNNFIGKWEVLVETPPLVKEVAFIRLDLHWGVRSAHTQKCGFRVRRKRRVDNGTADGNGDHDSGGGHSDSDSDGASSVADDSMADVGLFAQESTADAMELDSNDSPRQNMEWDEFLNPDRGLDPSWRWVEEVIVTNLNEAQWCRKFWEEQPIVRQAQPGDIFELSCMIHGDEDDVLNIKEMIFLIHCYASYMDRRDARGDTDDDDDDDDDDGEDDNFHRGFGGDVRVDAMPVPPPMVDYSLGGQGPDVQLEPDDGIVVHHDYDGDHINEIEDQDRVKEPDVDRGHYGQGRLIRMEQFVHAPEPAFEEHEHGQTVLEMDAEEHRFMETHVAEQKTHTFKLAGDADGDDVPRVDAREAFDPRQQLVPRAREYVPEEATESLANAVALDDTPASKSLGLDEVPDDSGVRPDTGVPEPPEPDLVLPPLQDLPPEPEDPPSCCAKCCGGCSDSIRRIFSCSCCRRPDPPDIPTPDPPTPDPPTPDPPTPDPTTPDSPGLQTPLPTPTPHPRTSVSDATLPPRTADAAPTPAPIQHAANTAPDRPTVHPVPTPVLAPTPHPPISAPKQKPPTPVRVSVPGQTPVPVPTPHPSTTGRRRPDSHRSRAVSTPVPVPASHPPTSDSNQPTGHPVSTSVPAPTPHPSTTPSKRRTPEPDPDPPVPDPDPVDPDPVVPDPEPAAVSGLTQVPVRPAHPSTTDPDRLMSDADRFAPVVTPTPDPTPHPPISGSNQPTDHPMPDTDQPPTIDIYFDDQYYPADFEMEENQILERPKTAVEERMEADVKRRMRQSIQNEGRVQTIFMYMDPSARPQGLKMITDDTYERQALNNIRAAIRGGHIPDAAHQLLEYVEDAPRLRTFDPEGHTKAAIQGTFDSIRNSPALLELGYNFLRMGDAATGRFIVETFFHPSVAALLTLEYFALQRVSEDGSDAEELFLTFDAFERVTRRSKTSRYIEARRNPNENMYWKLLPRKRGKCFQFLTTEHSRMEGFKLNAHRDLESDRLNAGLTRVMLSGPGSIGCEWEITPVHQGENCYFTIATHNNLFAQPPNWKMGISSARSSDGSIIDVTVASPQSIAAASDAGDPRAVSYWKVIPHEVYREGTDATKVTMEHRD